MAVTICSSSAGYSVFNPVKLVVVQFNSIWQAVDYCRSHGLVYSFALCNR